MATSLTNNTLTLNSQNYTAGTGGMLSIVPVGIEIRATSSDTTYWTLSSISVGESKRWETDGRSEWRVILPASGTYLSLSYNSTSVEFRSNVSGGGYVDSFVGDGGGGYLCESPEFETYNSGEVVA